MKTFFIYQLFHRDYFLIFGQKCFYFFGKAIAPVTLLATPTSIPQILLLNTPTAKKIMALAIKYTQNNALAKGITYLSLKM